MTTARVWVCDECESSLVAVEGEMCPLCVCKEAKGCFDFRYDAEEEFEEMHPALERLSGMALLGAFAVGLVLSAALWCAAIRGVLLFGEWLARYLSR